MHLSNLCLERNFFLAFGGRCCYDNDNQIGNVSGKVSGIVSDVGENFILDSVYMS